MSKDTQLFATIKPGETRILREGIEITNMGTSNARLLIKSVRTEGNDNDEDNKD